MSDAVTQQKPQRVFLRLLLRKVFLEDWGLKLLALFITLALWLGVTGLSTPTTKRFSSVPLNIDISSNAQIVNTPPQEVTIEVSGDKRKLDQINRATLSVSIDLSHFGPGDWVVTLSPDAVYVPLERGITLIDVAPGRIPVNIEAVEEKEIEVKSETTGTVAQGYEVYTSSAIPSKIRVRGPTSVVRVLDYVQTDRIDISGKKDNFTARQVAVSSPNPQAALLNTVVDVFFRIGERRIDRTFTIPINGEPGKMATFTIFGLRTLLQKARADDFKVEMFLDENGELKPRLILPVELQDVAEMKDLKLVK